MARTPGFPRHLASRAAGVVVLTLLGAQADAESCSKQKEYSILVHGGYVGEAQKDWVSAEVLELTRQIVARGRERLAAGTPAVDVVAEAITTFENSGLTDAGKGSFTNTAGFVEMDASLMVGATGKSGAVAAVQTLKNPILAARLVMEKTPHVLFVGSAGEQTLIGLGAEVVPDPKTYFVPVAWPGQKQEKNGTVGAVALDRCGELAAGTSTGGTHGKLPGRVGDSPIIGASTYANEEVAMSSTGVGELFIKHGATRDIAARVRYLHTPLREATNFVVHEVIGREPQARGAVIAISRGGEIVISSSGYGVLHGYATAKVPPKVGVKVE